MFEKLKQFLNEVKNEIKKVSWPNKQESIASTIITIIVVVFFAIFIGFNDLIYDGIIKIFFK